MRLFDPRIVAGISIFLIAVSSQSVCPVDDILDTQCMGPKDCLYPHPERCDQFIHCEVNPDGQTGRPTVKDCPDGLEWNDNKKECDWPKDSTCPDLRQIGYSGFKAVRSM